MITTATEIHPNPITDHPVTNLWRSIGYSEKLKFMMSWEGTSYDYKVAGNETGLFLPLIFAKVFALLMFLPPVFEKFYRVIKI
ncbi:MAG: hypothetical protein IPN13_12590 [Bacteroidetes bacterium]|nr:hypothetical protein [Bacteroidota bacterium]